MPARIFLTSGATWTVPADFTSTNTIEVIGAGGGGNTSAGGGAGAYSKTNNVALTPGASVNIQVGVGGASGVAGTDTWFGGSSFATSLAGAKGGSTASGTTGGTGGAAGSGVGAFRNSGGAGGNNSGTPGGGGGAAGLHGDGLPGGSGSAGSPGSGGNGDQSFGGLGGTSNQFGAGTSGAAGQEYDSTHGSGGGGGASNASLALDGSSQGTVVTSGTTATTTLTTTNSNDLVIVSAVANITGVSSQDVSSISDTAGLTWTKRKTQAVSGSPGFFISEWSAFAASPLSSNVITVTFTSAAAFGVVAAFGISGADTTTRWDSNVSLPAGSTSDPISINTSNANDFIFGHFRTGEQNPTAGTGWTQVIGANFQLIEYKIVSSTQSSLSVSIGTGAGTANGGIGDAVIRATASSGAAGGNYGGGGGGGPAGGGAGRDGLIIIYYESVGESFAGINQQTQIPARFGKNFTDPSRSVFSVLLPPPQPYGGWQATLDYKFSKAFPVTEQPFSAGRVDQPQTATVPQGWWGDFGHRFASKFLAAQQQFSVVPGDVPPSVTSYFAGYSAYNYVFLPLGADQVEFSILPLPLPATPPVPQGWAGDFGLAFSKPLSPALQQFIATRIDLPPTQVSSVWGYSAMDIVLLPLDPSEMDFASLRLDPPSSPTVPSGWWGDFGWKFSRTYPPTEQEFFADIWQGNVPTAATPQGWVGDLGIKLAKPFPAFEQQFSSLRVDQPPTDTPTLGGWNVTPSYGFIRPFSATQQQFFASRIDQPPTLAIPQGWQTRLDYAFGKPFPVGDQPYWGYQPRGSVPTAATPQGWWGYQPVVTGKPFPAKLQQYSAFTPRGIITVQAPTTADPYIYPGDKKKKKRLIDETLPELGIFDPRKLTRKQRRLLEQFEAQRWEKLTEGPTREQKLKEDMKAAIQEVLEKAERKRIEDTKVSGLFAAPPPVALEASLHAAIKVVKELERQHELDEARKALRRAKEEALAKVERDAQDAEKRVLEAKRAALKAKKAAQDAKLLATWRLKKKAEQVQVYDAVMDYLRPTKVRLGERADILEDVLDIAKRRK